jgi:hypothetical protein
MAPGRSEPAPGDGHRRLLSDDIPAEPDPAPAGKLEPQAARLRHRPREPIPENGRLQDYEQGPRSPGEGRESSEAVPDPNIPDRRIPSPGQVHDEHVDGPGGEDRARQGQCLLEIARGQDDEPVRVHSTRHGLHGIEGAGEIQPGHDRPRRLGLGRQSQGDGGLARGIVSAQRDRGGPRETPDAEERIQCREPGGDDRPIRVCGTVDAGGRRGSGRGWLRLDRQELRRSCEGTLDLRSGRARRRPRMQVSPRPRSCRTPARLERCERGCDLGRAVHRTAYDRTDVLSRQGSIAVHRLSRERLSGLHGRTIT